ncbi:MAG: OmpH family outer membrane protein [Alistipes sp.]|nr:OmpH family outer membrane protein [Alistipes sp.]
MKRIFFTAAMLLALVSCDTQRNGTEATEAATDPQEVAVHDLAYVQVEAVLSQCDLYQTEGIALKEKTEKAQQSWARKEQNFSYEMAQLQEKYQKGLITTANAQSTEQDIQRRVAAYQSQAQKEAQTLDEENFVFSNRAQDLLRRAVRSLNTDGRYKMIVNANALIEADTTLDITPAVLQEVNRLYALEKKEK